MYLLVHGTLHFMIISTWDGLWLWPQLLFNLITISRNSKGEEETGSPRLSPNQISSLLIQNSNSSESSCWSFWHKYEPRESGLDSSNPHQLWWIHHINLLHVRMFPTTKYSTEYQNFHPNVLLTTSWLRWINIWQPPRWRKVSAVPKPVPCLNSYSLLPGGKFEEESIVIQRCNFDAASDFPTSNEPFLDCLRVGLRWNGSLKVPTKLLYRGCFSNSAPEFADWLISGQLSMLAAVWYDFVSGGIGGCGPTMLSSPRNQKIFSTTSTHPLLKLISRMITATLDDPCQTSMRTNLPYTMKFWYTLKRLFGCFLPHLLYRWPEPLEACIKASHSHLRLWTSILILLVNLLPLSAKEYLQPSFIAL